MTSQTGSQTGSHIGIVSASHERTNGRTKRIKTSADQETAVDAGARIKDSTANRANEETR